ncbi:MAG: hypothetical protein ACO3FE_06355, partial [Planctomycetaceae bacterium]
MLRASWRGVIVEVGGDMIGCHREIRDGKTTQQPRNGGAGMIACCGFQAFPIRSGCHAQLRRRC